MIAVSVPSLVAAERDVLFGPRATADRAEHLRASSTSLTGRPIAFAAIAASTTCDHAEPLQPKPPPTNGEITRTSSGSMPSVPATRLAAAEDVLGGSRTGSTCLAVPLRNRRVRLHRIVVLHRRRVDLIDLGVCPARKPASASPQATSVGSLVSFSGV